MMKNNFFQIPVESIPTFGEMHNKNSLLMPIKSKTVGLITIFILAFACQHEVEYEYHKVYVDKYKSWHWGGGYYKETIYYSFTCQEEIYQAHCKIDNLTRHGYEWIKTGDSVLIRVPNGDCTKSEFVDLKYKKK